MSKKKHKDECCCCCNQNNCCCCNPCNLAYGNNNNNGFCGNGCWEAILFWLIACGAGLLNTNSILIILLFLLYGWCDGAGCCNGNGFGW